MDVTDGVTEMSRDITNSGSGAPSTKPLNVGAGPGLAGEANFSSLSTSSLMKRALLVGIDRYDRFPALSGGVNDVTAIDPLLARHADDSPNFHCRSLYSTRDQVTRRTLLAAIDVLLKPGVEVALLYFAGHGAGAWNDVVLVTQDGDNVDPGVPLSTILGRIQHSAVPEILLILDCCYSGGAGGVPQLGAGVSLLREGVTLLTAARKDQTAAETPEGRGLFSSLLGAALDGGAADVTGKVTTAGIYAFLSESLGAWEQRPTLKANLDRLHTIRCCTPAVPLSDLRKLATTFATDATELPLDPAYEPTMEPHDPTTEATFAMLQRCRAAKLVEPVGAVHMYDAAAQSKACRLTPLGRHYWRLAASGLL